MNNHPAIDQAVEFLRNRGVNIPVEVLQSLNIEITPDERKSIILAIKSGKLHSRYIKQSGEYQGVRDTLWIAIFDSVFDYLQGDITLGRAVDRMTLAMSEAYIATIDIAYEDGGGSLPVDEDTASWARSELQAQLGYVDSLFETLKELKKDGEFDANMEGANRADRYTSALDGFYNGVKLQGAENKMLTWNLGTTETHCKTCLNLDGQRHRGKWFIARGYIPRKPGSSTDCGGYHCDCSLTDDDGEEFTI